MSLCTVWKTSEKIAPSPGRGLWRTDTEEGADAALSIDTVRFQVANWSSDPPDTDTDGLINFEDVDDVGFLTELAISLQKEYDFDPNRTYATGFSNGGFMSYTLGCQHPEIFSGVVSMMGTMSGETWNSCTPSLPIPVLQMTGTLDSTVPMDGSMTVANGWGGAPHIYEIMDFWAGHNECQNKTGSTYK